MNKKLTLNIKDGIKYILEEIDEQDYNALLAFSALSKTDCKASTESIIDILTVLDIEHDDIIGIAGDSVHGPIFDNVLYTKLLPYTTIGQERSYYCYAGLDYSVKHCNDVLHDTSGTCLSCACEQLGRPLFVIIYSVPTIEADWKVIVERKIKLKDYVELHKKKIVQTEPSE